MRPWSYQTTGWEDPRESSLPRTPELFFGAWGNCCCCCCCYRTDAPGVALAGAAALWHPLGIRWLLLPPRVDSVSASSWVWSRIGWTSGCRRPPCRACCLEEKGNDFISDVIPVLKAIAHLQLRGNFDLRTVELSFCLQTVDGMRFAKTLADCRQDFWSTQLTVNDVKRFPSEVDDVGQADDGVDAAVGGEGGELLVVVLVQNHLEINETVQLFSYRHVYG